MCAYTAQIAIVHVTYPHNQPGDPEFISNTSNMIGVLGGAITGGILTLLLLTGVLTVTLRYCGRQLRTRYKPHSLISLRTNMDIANQFIMRLDYVHEALHACSYLPIR